VGKTSEREGVLLISSISGNYISAKIKPTEFYLSLPRFPCLKLTGRNPKSATSKSVLRQPYRTDCHSIKCCTILLENVPRIDCSCTAAVRPVRTIKCAFFLVFVLLYDQNRYNKFGRTKSVLYGFFFTAGCLEIRALVLPWNSCLFSAAFSSQKNRNFLFSCSLSISQSLLERMTSHLVFFLL
jgi:hypothetical protein